MSEILQFIIVAVIAVAVLAIVLKLFKFGFKTILIGIGAIFLLNLIPSVAIPVNWWTALITGIFGMPGVIVVLILSFFI